MRLAPQQLPAAERMYTAHLLCPAHAICRPALSSWHLLCRLSLCPAGCGGAVQWPLLTTPAGHWHVIAAGHQQLALRQAGPPAERSQQAHSAMCHLSMTRTVSGYSCSGLPDLIHPQLPHCQLAGLQGLQLSRSRDQLLLREGLAWVTGRGWGCCFHHWHCL